MKTTLYKLLSVFCAVVLLSSCGSRQKIVYIQGADEVGTFENPNSYSPTIKPDDRLTILINCKEPELAAPFNMMLTQRAFTSSNATVSMSAGSGSPMVYWVNPEGDINYPTIGKLHVAGMTRKELQEYIQNYLVSNGYIQDPIVNVDFSGAKYSILGEVARPGQFTMSSDRISLFDAIALAGDLTIYGERDKVRLIRENEGKQVVHTLDLRDKEIINSEFYWLQQNDVLIVEPNTTKASNREVSSLYSFAISLTSIALTIATFVRSFK